MTLLRSILMRLLSTAITLFGVAVIVFVVIRVVPGNPIAMMLPPGATEADIAVIQRGVAGYKRRWRRFKTGMATQSE